VIDNSVSAPTPARDGWFTSSYTNGTGACVEVKFGDSIVLVRDSKDRRDTDRPILTVAPPGWSTFLNTLTA
jgi:hypothetical protein